MLDDINKSVWIKEQIVRAEYEAALKKKYDKERELEIKRLREEKLKAEEEKLMAEQKVFEAQESAKQDKEARIAAEEEKHKAEENKIQIVKNLYDKKMPLEFISEVSNLSIDEVEAIIKNK